MRGFRLKLFWLSQFDLKHPILATQINIKSQGGHSENKNLKVLAVGVLV